MSYKTHMHGSGESYSGVVPTKQPNKGGRPSAEVVEGRPLTEENTGQSNQRRTPSRESGPSGLERVRKAAKKKDGKARFTPLDVFRHSPAWITRRGIRTCSPALPVSAAPPGTETGRVYHIKRRRY